MFTGIVTGLGRVAAFRRRRGGAQLVIAPPARYGRFRRGESVSVSGVCLTAVRSGHNLISDLSEETLRRSTLGDLGEGDLVNLERALAWGDRLSGHFVLGHIDGVARVLQIQPAGNSWLYRFSVPAQISLFVSSKGSIAVDGISLTVAARRPRSFDTAIIPETRRRTTLSSARPGTLVNVEADLFARYGARFWRRHVRLPRSRP
jgi:riboflavin synthase